ncbi:MAG: hypothetical protein ACLU61_08640 [Lachnospiraceae bacterium]
MDCKSQQSRKYSYGCTKYLMKQYRAASMWLHYQQQFSEEDSQLYNLILTRWMLRRLEFLIDYIRVHHPCGEKYYQTLYYVYMNERKLDKTVLLDRIGVRAVGHTVTEATRYRWQREALCILDEWLWKCNDECAAKYFEFMEIYSDGLVPSCVSELKTSYPQIM